MRLLILGGTRFLGRHTVEAALARGHEVTLFTRGRTPQPFGDRARPLAWDRDPRIAPGHQAGHEGGSQGQGQAGGEEAGSEETRAQALNGLFEQRLE